MTHPTPKSDLEVLLERTSDLYDAAYSDWNKGSDYTEHILRTSKLKDQMLRTMSEALEYISKDCEHGREESELCYCSTLLAEKAQSALTETARLAREALEKGN